MSYRPLSSINHLIKDTLRRQQIVRASYRGSLILGILVLLNSVIAPSVMAATAPSFMAASKSRAEADAQALVGPAASAAITGEVTKQSQPSAIPHPAKPLSVPTGVVSDGQAKDIAAKSLNVALGSSTGSGPQLVQTGNTFKPKTAQRNSSAASQASAEASLRQELAFQGYSKVQINAAVAALQEIKTSIDQQAANNTVSIPTHANGTIGFGANVTLSLPSQDSTSNATPLTQNAVVYSNTGASNDMVVKAVDAQTVETYQVIRDKSAPEQYVYQLNNLPAGVLLRQVDAQTVEAYFPQQTYGQDAQARTVPETVVATIKAPWARDANGTSVPISLTIGANDTVILHVLHKSGSYLYPIVADPVARWGWWGFMWWGDNWTISHYANIFEGIGLVAGIADWGVAIAIAGTIHVVAGWCEGHNGATFYFDWVGDFYYCHGW